MRTSERRLTHAQRLAKIGSWEQELETNKSEWSDEMFRILGRPREDAVGLSAFLNYVHPDDRERLLNCLKELRSSTAPVSMAYRIVRPDGEVRFLSTVSETIRNAQGEPVRLLGVSQDVTEQVEARELLRESEER